jgi:hypothetical protein
MSAMSSPFDAAPAVAAVTSDADLVRLAYCEAVKSEVSTLISNYITRDDDPEGKFLAGLAIIRKARDRALELVAKDAG